MPRVSFDARESRRSAITQFDLIGLTTMFSGLPLAQSGNLRAATATARITSTISQCSARKVARMITAKSQDCLHRPLIGMLFSVSLHVALLVGLSQTLSTTSPAPSTRHFQGATSMQVMLLNPPTTPFVPSSVITGTRLQKAVGVLSPKFTVLPDAATTMDANTTAEPAAPMTSLNLPNEKLSGTAPAQHRTSATESSALPPPEQSARPDYAYNPAPEYPMLLREHGVGGTVWLRVWVDSEGHPANVKVAKGSGYRLFDEAALRVVANWRFIPAQAGEQKLASWVEFPVRFTLNG